MPLHEAIFIIIADESGLEAALEGARASMPDFDLTFARAPGRPSADLPADLAIVDAAASGSLDVVRALCRQRPGLPILAGCRASSTRRAADMLDAGADDTIDADSPPTFLGARLRQSLERGRLADLVQRQKDWATEQTRRIGETLRAQEEEIVLRLSLANEMRDNETAEHIVRMARYCVLIAEQLGFPRETCDFLYLAAQMHDIGKIGVPDAILCKTGLLSPDERRIMERHTLVAENILKGSRSALIQLAEIIATTHHERWDGAGYPRQLKGTDIPIAGRIAAVADVFDALASPRRYKPGWTLDAARAELERNRGLHFDPACVDALLARWADVIAIAATTPPVTAAQALVAGHPVTASVMDTRATG
jgi:putative two-component system response regulator